MDPAEIRLAVWVRRTRKAKGWTREELSEVSGYSVGVIDRLEGGYGTTALAAAGSIVEALGGQLRVCDESEDAQASR
jgi:transcriptional regulator with XRE-family HTH domain